MVGWVARGIACKAAWPLTLILWLVHLQESDAEGVCLYLPPSVTSRSDAPWVAYLHSLRFFKRGGRDINIGPLGNHYEAVSKAIYDAGLRRGEVSITAAVGLLGGYERTLLKVAAMLKLLTIPFLDVILLSLRNPGYGQGVLRENGESLSKCRPFTATSPGPAWLGTPIVHTCLAGSWSALEHAKRSGMVRQIGTYDHDVTLFDHVMAISSEPPDLVQIEMPWGSGMPDWKLSLSMAYLRVRNIKPLISMMLPNGTSHVVESGFHEQICLDDLEGRSRVVGLLGRGLMLSFPPACEAVLLFSLAVLQDEESLLKGAREKLAGSPLGAVWTDYAAFSVNRPGQAASAFHGATLQAEEGMATQRHARTLFLAMCMGVEYFNTFCGPFLASFVRAYDPQSGHKDLHGHRKKRQGDNHTILVWAPRVDEPLLVKTKKLLSTASLHVEFDTTLLKEELALFNMQGNAQSVMKEERHCEYVGPEPRKLVCVQKHDDRARFHDLLFFNWARRQILRTEGEGYNFTVCMDSDALFVRSLEGILDGSWMSSTGFGVKDAWDVMIVYYDQQHTVPWGTVKQASATVHGFVRIQGGMLILRHGTHALVYLDIFQDHLLPLVGLGRKDGVPDKSDQLLVKEFRSASQAAIAKTIGIENLKWGDDCIVCTGSTVPAKALEASKEKWQHVQMPRILGVPARVLNQAESLVGGRFTADTHIVHLKGMWWRTVLGRGNLVHDHHRHPSWNWQTLALWVQMRSLMSPGWTHNFTFFVD